MSGESYWTTPVNTETLSAERFAEIIEGLKARDREFAGRPPAIFVSQAEYDRRKARYEATGSPW